jgi:hypothetical protein
MPKERIALTIYILCFAEGTINHLLDFISGGWAPYHLGPSFLRVFWTLLVVLDPAVIALLISGWRRTGLLAACGLMLADVAANSYASFVLHYQGFAVALPLQTLFLGFVLGSAGFLWPTAKSRTAVAGPRGDEAAAFRP